MKQLPLTTARILARPFLRVRVLMGLFSLVAGLSQTFAADRTWDGGGDQSSWANSAANWDNDTLPVAGDRLFFDGSVGLFPNNDFPGGTIFSNITFNAGAGTFSLAGNGL